MENEKSILEIAHEIVNNRDEDKDRRYGNFDECMGRVSALASILTGKQLTVDDAYWILVCLKLSRESHYHKQDNMVDLVGYIQGLHSWREKSLKEEDKLSEAALEERMKHIGQNGNDGLHYDVEYDCNECDKEIPKNEPCCYGNPIGFAELDDVKLPGPDSVVEKKSLEQLEYEHNVRKNQEPDFDEHHLDVDEFWTPSNED